VSPAPKFTDLRTGHQKRFRFGQSAVAVSERLPAALHIIAAASQKLDETFIKRTSGQCYGAAPAITNTRGRLRP
jgi:hypothetical protein